MRMEERQMSAPPNILDVPTTPITEEGKEMASEPPLYVNEPVNKFGRTVWDEPVDIAADAWLYDDL